RHFAVPHEPSRLKDANEASGSGSQLSPDASSPAADELSSAEPQQADLLTRFLPFDRASLENAIDEFLEQVNDLGASLPDLSVPMRLVPATLAVASALLASEAALRLRLRSQTAEPEAEDESGSPPFPGLPNIRTRSIP
ncbi:MAG TPA: hypothetical protein VGY53_03835, partial [Isosphaeraceae bacterium]|nr:hypothetical protein [Isosphaeraceae bacterium]